MNSGSKTTVALKDDGTDLIGTESHWLKSLQEYCLALARKARESRIRSGLGALLIFTLVFIVYSPILPGSFLMDDHRLIKEDNALVNGQLGPLNIWFQTDFTLSTFALWLQWLAWGENPGFYHAVNMLLHALSAVLLWRLLARLKIPGSWLAAALFAVHPVCVNSVARIAEIKNTLSLPFFILSFWLYLHYEALSLKPVQQNRRGQAALWYGLSLVAFVLALLSKTSTVMLPLVLLACAAWQRRRITRQDLLQTGPFFILALGFGLMSAWFQKHQALAGLTLQPENFGERLAAAGRVFWFYLGKALLPLNLSIVYVRWKIDVTTLAAYLPVFLLAAGFLLCWWFRNRWGRHALFGLGCFLITLFPSLGFFDAQFLTMWQVSDHLQYLPLIAPVALAVAGLACRPNAKVFKCLALALVLVLSVLTSQRARVFATEENLFLDTLAKNPAASGAHNDLGVILAKRGNYPEAIAHFVAAAQSNPDNAGAQLNLGQALALQGKFAEAEPHFLAAIKLKPDDARAHKSFAEALGRQGRTREALLHLQVAICLQPDVQTRLDLAGLLYQTGNPRQAADQFRKALLLKPDMPEPLNNLAWILATCSDDTVRNGDEAVRHAERACRLTAFKHTRTISTLAAAYAEAGRFSEAVATAEMAMKLQIEAGEMQMADVNNQLLPLYRAGKPYHEKPAATQARNSSTASR
ncbi:MAG: tetratricopeptide repeat protein [Verrucomicrobiia bacterium]